MKGFLPAVRCTKEAHFRFTVTEEMYIIKIIAFEQLLDRAVCLLLHKIISNKYDYKPIILTFSDLPMIAYGADGKESTNYHTKWRNTEIKSIDGLV